MTSFMTESGELCQIMLPDQIVIPFLLKLCFTAQNGVLQSCDVHWTSGSVCNKWTNVLQNSS